MFRTAHLTVWVRSIIKDKWDRISYSSSGKGPPFCGGNAYKWPSQGRRPRGNNCLSGWPGFPSLTEHCCCKHFTLLIDSSIFSCFLHKINFSFFCSHFWSSVQPWYQLLAFVFIFPPLLGGSFMILDILGRFPFFHARGQQMNPVPWSFIVGFLGKKI